MRNSTLLTLALLVLVVALVVAMRRAGGRLEHVEARLKARALPDFAREDSLGAMAEGPGPAGAGLGGYAADPRGPAPMTVVQQQMGGAPVFVPPAAPQAVLALDGPGPSLVPLPVSGRFYDSGEFHVAGHVARLRTSRADLPPTLPLYARRVPTPARESAWLYAAVWDRRKLPVFTSASARQPGGCLSDGGCLELASGEHVVVPDLDPREVWRVKMYSKI